MRKIGLLIFSTLSFRERVLFLSNFGVDRGNLGCYA